MKATLRHIYMCRTANMSLRTCVVIKQIQSNQPTCMQNRPTCWQLASEVDPHGPSCSDSRVAWDFDSPWITGPMTAHQSVAYVRHIILAPAANLCNLSAIVFLPIKAWIWRHIRRYLDGSTILLTVNGPVWPRWRFRHASRRKLCGVKQHFDKMMQFVTNCPYHQTISYPLVTLTNTVYLI